MTIGAGKVIVYGTMICAAIAAGTFYSYKEEHRAQVLEIYIIDTPGWPSVFIRSPADVRMLIGGGSNAEIIRTITNILPFYSRRIDYVVATVFDGRNAGGLIDVLERYRIGSVILPGEDLNELNISTSTDQVFDTFLNQLTRRSIPVQRMTLGDVIHFDERVNAEVLFPAASSTFQYSKSSYPELAFKLNFADRSFVFTGKTSKKIQKYISETGRKTDVLITFLSPSESNLSGKLVDAFDPEYLIYRAAKEPAKDKMTAFAGIVQDRRFNLRDKAIKIKSNGGSMLEVGYER